MTQLAMQDGALLLCDGSLSSECCEPGGQPSDVCPPCGQGCPQPILVTGSGIGPCNAVFSAIIPDISVLCLGQSHGMLEATNDCHAEDYSGFDVFAGCARIEDFDEFPLDQEIPFVGAVARITLRVVEAPPGIVAYSFFRQIFITDECFPLGEFTVGVRIAGGPTEYTNGLVVLTEAP